LHGSAWRVIRVLGSVPSILRALGSGAVGGNSMRKLLAAYYHFLESVYLWFMMSRIRAKAFPLLVIAGLLAPLVLLAVPHLWFRVVSIGISLFDLSLLFTVILLDTFGAAELGVRSSIVHFGGPRHLRRIYGRGSLVLYVLVSLLTASFYYALIFLALDDLSPGIHFENLHPTLRFLDFFLYSLVTVSLLGYGDINPVSALAKVLSISGTVLSMLIVIVMASLVLSDE
jgi:hypothetical protein